MPRESSDGAFRKESLRVDLVDVEALDPVDPVIPAAAPDEWALVRKLAAAATCRFGDIASVRVGEVDQTMFREHMLDRDTGTLLARGAHLRPFHVNLGVEDKKERWIDEEGFLAAKGRMAEEVRNPSPPRCRGAIFMPSSGRTRRRASGGCASWPASASARAWPTTWAWERPFRCFRCCSC